MLKKTLTGTFYIFCIGKRELLNIKKFHKNLVAAYQNIFKRILHRLKKVLGLYSLLGWHHRIVETVFAQIPKLCMCDCWKAKRERKGFQWFSFIPETAQLNHSKRVEKVCWRILWLHYALFSSPSLSTTPMSPINRIIRKASQLPFYVDILIFYCDNDADED